MPRADIRVDLGPRGASLRTIARELRGMDGRQVKEIFRHALEGAARPYPRRVRASVLAIPVKEGGKHTGLRARIAGCVELSTGTDAKSAYASVWVNPFRMLPDYTTLPLYMEGVNEGRRRRYDRWRHPVFGRSEDPWVQQAAHPYFYQAASPLGRASGEALKVALEDITRKING
jgi:hypothetical protein